MTWIIKIHWILYRRSSLLLLSMWIIIIIKLLLLGRILITSWLTGILRYCLRLLYPGLKLLVIWISNCLLCYWLISCSSYLRLLLIFNISLRLLCKLRSNRRLLWWIMRPYGLLIIWWTSWRLRWILRYRSLRLWQTVNISLSLRWKLRYIRWLWILWSLCGLLLILESNIWLISLSISLPLLLRLLLRIYYIWLTRLIC